VAVINEKPAVDGFFALHFDGVDDVVNAGTLDGTNLQSYTYEAWINPASYGGYGYVGFGRLFEGKAATIFLMGEQNNNYPDHSLVISTGGGSYHTQENSIDLNKWQHVAVTFDNNTKELTVYLDGTAIPVVTKTAATTIDNNAANSLYIGNRSDLARAFDGIMDAARVWSVAKTQADVIANMHSSAVGQDNLVAEFLFDEGYYNSKAYSGTIEASILNADITDSENSIWVEPTVEFTEYQIPSQVIDFQELGENYYRTEVPQSADLATLVPSFVTSMNNTNVTVGGVEQESGVTAVDFTNSATIPVEYTLTATYFGKSISNTYQLEVEKELSAECVMLSLNLSEISFSASPVDMDNIITVANGTDVTAITTNFTISADASAFVNDVEITSGTQLDYSNPVVIKVVAANDRTIDYYNISIRQEQTITWEPASLAKVYGDPVFTLQGTSNSGLELYYESSNPDVISVAMNKATVKGVGTATITAYQQGTNSFAEATPVEKVFTVSKKALTITADSKTIEYSDPIPELTMTFNGLLDGEDESVINELPVIATSAVQNSPAGDYPITLSGGSDENYEITLVNGTLTIQDVAAYDVTFSVTYGGSADQDVNININNIDLTTDVNGEATIKLKAGSYPYLATKAEREEYSGTVTVVDANQTIDIVLQDPLPVYTVAYTTDGNGTISGNETQSVKQGYDSEEVTAIPATGYIFNQWNDGITTATRFEENVQGDVSVIAQFELKTYTLTYDAGTNGTLSGDAVQTVEHGSDGTAVEAIPATGYSFVQWSDGVTDNPRTDVNVMMNMSVTAEYTKIYTLPYTQTFDGTTLPEDWENLDNNGSGCMWEFKAQAGKYTKVSLSGSTPNAAILDSDNYGSGKSQNADLISPSFNLSSYSAVNLKFNHYYKHYSGSSATLSYSINGGEWVEIQKWTSNTTNPAAFDQNIDAIAGQVNVRFKWSYIGSWAYYWLVDDIEITGVAAAGEYTVTYTAGANGTLEGATGGVITQSVTAGENGPTVTAVPDPGYAFYQWSDGVTDNPRTDIVISEIDVTAIFGSDCAPISSLPYLEDFNASTTVPDCWEIPGSNPGGFTWEFGTMNNFGSPVSLGTTGNNAYFNSGETNYGTEESVDLISPTFDLSSYSNVYLSFKHYQYSYGSNSSSVSYSIDGGSTWVTIQSWTEALDDVEFFSQEIAAVAGESNVKFKWNNTATWDFGWIIDDIELKSTPSYMLSYYANDYDFGYIDGLSYQSVDENGSGQEVTAIPYDGYRFVKWDDENTSATRTDANVTANAVYTAIFEAITYTLTYTTDGNGTIAGEAAQTVAEGANGTEVEAIPTTGYHFVKWSDESTANPRTDLAVTADITVSAIFEINTYTLTYTAGANGSITGTATQTVNHGADGTAVEAVAATGYHFVKWSDESTNNPRTDLAVTADITVSAVFEINTYTLTYTAGANGSITGTTTQTVNHGADGTAVEAVAATGYHFVKWSDESTVNPRTDLAVTTDITVSAVFEINTYTLTYTAGANGSITGTTTQTVNHGADGTAVEAVAATGYHFVKWSDESTVNPRTDVNVTTDIKVSAIFEESIYTITFTINNGTNPIQNANVVIDSETLVTNSNGQTTLQRTNGDYAFTVTAEGYQEATGTITVNNQDVNQTVTLSETTGFDDITISQHLVYPNPFTNKLTISNAQQIVKASIVNVDGQLKKVLLHNGSDKLSVETSDLTQGAYLVCIELVTGEKTIYRVVKF